MKEKMLGYEIDSLPAELCVVEIFAAVSKPGSGAPFCKWLACLNPHSYVVALDDTQFSLALKNADWLVADGTGVVLASRLLGGQIRKRTTGSDIFLGMHHLMNAQCNMSVFFLGATEITLTIIREKMAKDYPNIRIAGTYSPPFKPVYSPTDIDTMIEAINAAKADILWVGLTAPKQEKWIYENRLRLNVRFAGAIGAVFDFYSGQVKRSHPIFQRLGLEWLPRLIQQPKRLWRRMFVSAPIFLWHAIKMKLNNR